MPTLPPRLFAGDVVAVVCPSSPPPDARNIDLGLAAMEKLGFRPILMPNARRRFGYLAGNDAARASDLMAAFSNPEVKGIFCVRGGFGASRLLPLLDFTTIRRNPKIFVGYSDITALHCTLLTKANLVSFHGPMLNADFVRYKLPAFSRDSLLRTLTSAKPPGSICAGYSRKTVEVLRGGVATGPLIGGNLTTLCTLLGTPWQPSFSRAILFIEEVNEAPYRVDRLLTHLQNAGALRKLAGVAIGLCDGCVDATRNHREFRQTLRDVLQDRLGKLGIPIVTGLPFGHVRLNATLPIGVKARLDGKIGDLTMVGRTVH